MHDFILDSWMGLFAPAKTPAAVVERLRGATVKTVEHPEVRRRLEAAGWRVMTMSADEMRALVKREAEKWPAILRQAGLQPD